MKSLATAAWLLTILLTACATSESAIDEPVTVTAGAETAEIELPGAEALATPEHEWLMQWVGEWDASCEAIVEPGGAPQQWETHETVEALGDLWVIASAKMNDDSSTFASRLTVGFDPAEGVFVGNWVDSIQTRMWTYRGKLSDDGRTLVLEAQGPSITEPGATAHYRDQVEMVNADQRRWSSSMLGDDGAWTTFMTMEYQRRK